MADLKVWHDGVDWFVAETEEEAEVLRGKHYECAEHHGLRPWAEWPKPTLRITPDDGSTWEEKTLAEWIAQNGRGFLCSTEW